MVAAALRAGGLPAGVEVGKDGKAGNGPVDWDSLRADPVYADFVLPGWTAAEQRAELATVRAETEAARAELATERAEVATERAETEAARAELATERAETEAAARQQAETELARLRAQIAASKQ